MDTGHRFLLCDECGSHLLGLHFVCVECYNVSERTYDLCCSCYRNNNFDHVHSFFLDNYALLRHRPAKEKEVSTSRTIGGSSKREKIKETAEQVKVVCQAGSAVINVANSCNTM